MFWIDLLGMFLFLGCLFGTLIIYLRDTEDWEDADD